MISLGTEGELGNEQPKPQEAVPPSNITDEDTKELWLTLNDLSKLEEVWDKAGPNTILPSINMILKLATFARIPVEGLGNKPTPEIIKTISEMALAQRKRLEEQSS